MSYFNANPATPQDWSSTDYAGLDAQLHTEDGFAANVVAAANPRIIIIPVAIVFAAIVLMAENVFLSSPTSHDMTLLQRLHWAFSPVTVDGFTNTFFYTLGLLPVLMVAGVVVYFIYKKTTQASSTAALYTQFQQGGWLAELTSTGLAVPVGRNLGLVNVFGTPGLPAGTVEAAAARISQAISDRRNPQTRAYIRAAIGAFRRVKLWQAVPASQIDPGMPQGVFLAVRIGGRPRGPLLQVVIPGNGQLNLHGLKRDGNQNRAVTIALLIVGAGVLITVLVSLFG